MNSEFQLINGKRVDISQHSLAAVHGHPAMKHLPDAVHRVLGKRMHLESLNRGIDADRHALIGVVDWPVVCQIDIHPAQRAMTLITANRTGAEIGSWTNVLMLVVVEVLDTKWRKQQIQLRSVV